MAEPVVFPLPVHFKDAVSFASPSVSFPASSIRNSQVASDAAIEAGKLLHMVNVPTQLASPTTIVIAQTYDCYVAKGAGTLTSVRAAVNGTIATDVSRTVTVDLQKSTGGGAFATVLSGTVGFTSSSVLRTLVTGTISSASYAAGDMFRWVVTVAGGSGNQAIGLIADFVAYEATT